MMGQLAIRPAGLHRSTSRPVFFCVLPLSMLIPVRAVRQFPPNLHFSLSAVMRIRLLHRSITPYFFRSLHFFFCFTRFAFLSAFLRRLHAPHILPLLFFCSGDIEPDAGIGMRLPFVLATTRHRLAHQIKCKLINNQTCDLNLKSPRTLHV